MRTELIALIYALELDPNQATQNGQTIYQRLEAAIYGTVEDIEEEMA